MSTVYVAPTIDTHDAARTAQSVLERAPLDAVIAVLKTQTDAVAVTQVAARVVAETERVNEAAAQKAKGKV